MDGTSNGVNGVSEPHQQCQDSSDSVQKSPSKTEPNMNGSVREDVSDDLQDATSASVADLMGQKKSASDSSALAPSPVNEGDASASSTEKCTPAEVSAHNGAKDDHPSELTQVPAKQKTQVPENGSIPCAQGIPSDEKESDEIIDSKPSLDHNECSEETEVKDLVNGHDKDKDEACISNENIDSERTDNGKEPDDCKNEIETEMSTESSAQVQSISVLKDDEQQKCLAEGIESNIDNISRTSGDDKDEICDNNSDDSLNEVLDQDTLKTAEETKSYPSEICDRINGHADVARLPVIDRLEEEEKDVDSDKSVVGSCDSLEQLQPESEKNGVDDEEEITDVSKEHEENETSAVALDKAKSISTDDEAKLEVMSHEEEDAEAFQNGKSNDIDETHKLEEEVSSSSTADKLKEKTEEKEVVVVGNGHEIKKEMEFLTAKPDVNITEVSSEKTQEEEIADEHQTDALEEESKEISKTREDQEMTQEQEELHELSTSEKEVCKETVSISEDEGDLKETIQDEQITEKIDETEIADEPIIIEESKEKEEKVDITTEETAPESTEEEGVDKLVTDELKEDESTKELGDHVKTVCESSINTEIKESRELAANEEDQVSGEIESLDVELTGDETEEVQQEQISGEQEEQEDEQEEILEVECEVKITDEEIESETIGVLEAVKEKTVDEHLELEGEEVTEPEKKLPTLSEKTPEPEGISREKTPELEDRALSPREATPEQDKKSIKDGDEVSEVEEKAALSRELTPEPEGKSTAAGEEIPEPEESLKSTEKTPEPEIEESTSAEEAATQETLPVSREKTPEPDEKASVSREKTPEPEEKSATPGEETAEVQEILPISREKSPELQEKSPTPRIETPETQEEDNISEPELKEPREKTPEAEEKAPTPGEKSLEPEEKVPTPGEKSPEPEEKAATPGEKSPEPEEKAPTSGEKSPEPEEKVSTPREKSPEPEEKAPTPGEKSPEPELKAPTPGEKSPEPEEKAPTPGVKSPEPEEKAPTPREKTPEPEEKVPTPREKTPEPEEKISTPREKTPEPEEAELATNGKPPEDEIPEEVSSEVAQKTEPCIQGTDAAVEESAKQVIKLVQSSLSMEMKEEDAQILDKPADDHTTDAVAEPSINGEIKAEPVIEAAEEKLVTTPKEEAKVSVAQKKEADNDSGVDETTQAKVESSPKKTTHVSLKGVKKKPQPQVTSPSKRRLASPTKTPTSPTKPMATARSPSSGGPPSSKTTPPRTTPTQGEKKLPMNKVVVGLTPSPNIREVKSKIGSMQNINHRPGGGNIRVETKKIDLTQAKSKVGSVDNITYKPGGGDKKIYSKKMDWKAAPKVGSMDNATHKPGGGNKKIDMLKLDFKEKAQSKVGSKDNIKHVPGGGAKQIETIPLDFKSKAQSRVGSFDNVKHVPGGGNKEIFDDRTYAKRSPSKSRSVTNSDGHISEPQSPFSMSPLPPHEGQTPSSEDAAADEKFPGVTTEAEQ